MTYLYALPNDKAKGVQFPGLEHVVCLHFLKKGERSRQKIHLDTQTFKILCMKEEVFYSYDEKKMILKTFNS